MTATFDFIDKCVFVAGGTSGINLGVARAFAGEGARLVVLSRRQEKVDRAVDELSRWGRQALGFAADVRDPAAVEAALDAVVEAFGPIDVVISGAAGNFPAKAAELSPNGFKAVVDIDLNGTFHVLRAAYPHLRRPGACVINISAPQAVLAMPLQIHVCAAKAGVDMVTRCLATEWGPEGIRVNSVIPGPIAETEGMRRLAPTEDLAAVVRRTVPMGRFGTAEDIAGACLFLASPLAGFINGAVLPVDGGWALGGAAESMAVAAGVLAK